METRIALVGIIVENKESAQRINEILHDKEYLLFRIGREHRMAGGRDDAVVDLKERLLDERGKFCSLRKSRS